MAATAKRGYPQSNGAKVEWVGRVSGAVYVAGTAQTISPRAIGIDTIEHITGGVSESGTYFVLGKTTVGQVGGIHWFTASTGAEVVSTDLSAEFVTIRVIGIG